MTIFRRILKYTPAGLLGWATIEWILHSIVVSPNFDIRFELAILISLLLPLAIGSFTGFRFRLWHYLAYTALVAVELAYYFQWRWQG